MINNILSYNLISLITLYSSLIGMIICVMIGQTFLDTISDKKYNVIKYTYFVFLVIWCIALINYIISVFI